MRLELEQQQAHMEPSQVALSDHGAQLEAGLYKGKEDRQRRAARCAYWTRIVEAACPVWNDLTQCVGWLLFTLLAPPLVLFTIILCEALLAHKSEWIMVVFARGFPLCMAYVCTVTVLNSLYSERLQRCLKRLVQRWTLGYEGESEHESADTGSDD